MKYKVSSSKVRALLEELKEISRQEFLLFSANGKVVANTTDIPEGFSAIVAQFADSLAETQIVQNWVFFRVELEQDIQYILLTERYGMGEQYIVVGRMAVSQLKHFIENSSETVNTGNILRQMIYGEVSEQQMGAYIHTLKLRSGRYMVYLIQNNIRDNVMVLELLKNLFAVRHEDYLVELDSTRTVLIKNVSDIDNSDYNTYAHSIVENLQMEAMANAWVGYGSEMHDFKHLREVYLQAVTALNIGMKFYVEDHVFDYYHLGIGRIIAELPLEQSKLYLEEVLGENAYVELDEETQTTINYLFDNNLNISETARQLFIHRNTLVYRLERIEKRLGLDIRNFEDAMLFKIAMMVRMHIANLEES